MNQLHRILIRAPPEPVVEDIAAQPTQLGWVLGGSATSAHYPCGRCSYSSPRHMLLGSHVRRLLRVNVGGKGS